jgi:hypothetical protein
MRKTLNELSFPLILTLALFTPLVIACIWIGFIVTDHSIFPTDIYGAYKGWYEPGNAIKINNHYSLDLNFIGFPWKYYLASRPPEEIACTTSFPFFTFGHQGIKLPDGSCYPLGVSCFFILLDPRRWLEKILPFFVAYDLGYLGLVILIWLTVFLLLRRMKFGATATILGSAVSLETFWISKELQYDLFIASVPFLYLAFACLVKARSQRIGKGNYWLFGIFALLTLLLTSIQGFVLIGIAFFVVLSAYFIACGWPLFRDRHFWIRLSGIGLLIYSIVSVLTFPSFLAFFKGSHRYVPANSFSQEVILMLKRAILPFLTSITIPTANLFGSFDTIDPFKVLGSFGGREYASIDTLTLYCGSLYALLWGFILLASWQKNPGICGLASSAAFRFWFVCFAGAWLICTLPTYKFLYFRFFQFTIGFSAPIFVALALEEIPEIPRKIAWIAFKKLAFLAVGMWVAIAILGRVLSLDRFQKIVLNKLGTGGILGFEPGFWEFRYQRFVERLSLENSYSISLLLVQILLFVALYFYLRYGQISLSRRSLLVSALALVLVQAIAITDSIWHTWNWQWPQRTRMAWIIDNPYWKEKGIQGLTETSPDNAPTPNPNFLILYNVQPPSIYDSLMVEPEKK